MTRLWFPKPLKYGEQAYFASEAVYDQSDDGEQKDWIDVEVDHHGIARGRLLYAQKLPIRGLTIRIKFDDAIPARSRMVVRGTHGEGALPTATGRQSSLDTSHR